MRQATVFFWFSKQGLQGWAAFIRLGPSYQSQAYFSVLHREWVVSLHADLLLVLLRWGHWLGKLGGYWTWLCEPVHDLDNGQGFGCRFHDQKASCSPWARTSSPHVRRWSLETHTFIYAWGEFTPILEDVANIIHFSIVSNVDPFHYVIPPADTDTFDNLKNGAPTSPSKALRFNE